MKLESALAVQAVEDRISQKDREIQEKCEELKIVDQKLAEALEKADHSPSRELQDAFSKLKQESDKKEAKNVSLNKVVQQVSLYYA